MDAFDEIEEKIRQREDALKARELKLRLKEIEQELDDIPVQPTVKHREPAKPKARRMLRKIGTLGKFLLIVISVIVAIRIAAWVSTLIILFGVGWVAYKLFIESD